MEAAVSSRTPPHLLVSSPLLSVRNLHYAYDSRAALRGVSLAVDAGEFVVLMGRNGSGKSTLLKQIVGLIKPGEGQVTVAGLDTRKAELDDIIKTVGYVPQHRARCYSATRWRRSWPSPVAGTPCRPILRRIKRCSNGSAWARWRTGTHRDLSGGEQQRAALASILAANPQIILLDEPTRGLDYAQKRSLTDLLLGLKREGRTIIMATHDVELAAACADRAVLMAEGQIVVDGSAREVMSDSQVFSSQINKLFRDPQYLVVEDVLRAIGK